MSWMFTRLEGLDMFVNLRQTMLDDPSLFTPFIETWTSEKLPLGDHAGGAQRYQVAGFRRIAGLAREYAAQASFAAPL